MNSSNDFEWGGREKTKIANVVEHEMEIGKTRA